MTGEVYIEFIPAGASVRVSAIDAATGVEVSIIGPASAHRGDLERLAIAKLARRLGRATRPDDGKEKTPPEAGRGVIV